MHNDRPYKNVDTHKLKLALGVGEAGLKIWNKRSKRYSEVIEELDKIRKELMSRGEVLTT